MTLQKRDELGLAVLGADLHPNDVLMPLVALVQPTSGEGTPGKYRRMDTGEELTSLRVIPVVVQQVRTLWPEGFSRDSRPACWSNDGQNAAPGVPDEYKGRSCRQCPLYTDRFSTEKDKFQCVYGYRVLLFDVEHDEAFLMRLSGTSVKLASALVGPVRRPNMHRRVLTLTAAEQVNDSGRWWSPRVTGAEDATEGQKEAATTLWKLFGRSAVAYVPDDDDDHDVGDAESVVVSPGIDTSDLPF